MRSVQCWTWSLWKRVYDRSRYFSILPRAPPLPLVTKFLYPCSKFSPHYPTSSPCHEVNAIHFTKLSGLLPNDTFSSFKSVLPKLFEIVARSVWIKILPRWENYNTCQRRESNTESPACKTIALTHFTVWASLWQSFVS